MSTFFGTRKVEALGTFTVSGVNTIEFIAGQPAKIHRVVFVYTTANTTAGSVVTARTRITPGSDTGATTLGTFTTGITKAIGTAETVQFGQPGDTDGTAVTGAPGIGGQTTYVATPDLPSLRTGDSFALTSDGAGTAGIVDVFVEYFEGTLGEEAGSGDAAKVTELTFTAA